MEKDGRRYTGLYFDGTNFDSWQFGMRLTLQSDELWLTTNGTETRPETVRILSLYS
jgi:hypothetical protein